MTSTHLLGERELLAAAGDGDTAAFERIVGDHRAELHAHCYRMLGSVHDADDALQETLVRAWRGLPGFGGRSSLRTWLYRIATNVCLDAIAKQSKRVLPADYGPPSPPDAGSAEPLVESVWIEPYPDDVELGNDYAAPDARYEQREALELAFIAALQHLPATQRAVLILREVLGFSAKETSEALETSVASVNSALQRARKAVEERLPERSQQETLRSLGDEQLRNLVQRFVDAWARGDVATVAALLAEDAVFSMPPWPAWWRGRDTIAGFVGNASESCPEVHPVYVRLNAQLAVAYYALDVGTGTYSAHALDVITLDGAMIKEVTAFVAPTLFPRLGLPATVVP
jgi:RNA polymerase sigma-70 factor (ECF subfamily)